MAFFNKLLDVFRAADRLAEAEGRQELSHDRSMYWDLAEKMQDEPRTSQIKAWATVKYLRNLPDAYDLSLSLPRSAVTDLKAWDPFELLNMIPEETKKVPLQDIDSIILNPTFLLNLEPDSIGTFRSYTEFKNLQTALTEGQADSVLRTLGPYLMRISSESPKHYAPWKDKIANLEHERKFKVYLVWTARTVAALAAATTPYLAGALGALSFLLASRKDTETRITGGEKQAKLELSLRYRASTETLADFCHEVKAAAGTRNSNHGRDPATRS